MALQFQVKLPPPRFAHTRLHGPVKVSKRTIELLDPCSECQEAHQNDAFPSASARSKTLLNSFRAGSTCDSFKDFDGKVCFYDILAKSPVLLPASRDPVLAQEECVIKCREVLALRTRAWQEVAFTSCDDVAVSSRLRSSDLWMQEAQFFLQQELKTLEAAKKGLVMPVLASMLAEPLPSAFRFVSLAEFLVYCEAERFTRLLLIRTVDTDGKVKDEFMFIEPRVALLGYTLYQLSGTIEHATYFIRHVPSDWFVDVIRSEYKTAFFALGPAREAAAPGQVHLVDNQLFTKALTRTCACKLELKKRFGCCCSANLALYSGEQRGFFLAQYTPGTLVELVNIYRDAHEAYPHDVHLRTDMIERLKLQLPETGDEEGVQRMPWFKRHGHLPEECTTCHELFYVKIVHEACGHQVACSHFKCFTDFFVDPSMKFRSTRTGQQCPLCQSPYPADKYKAQGLEDQDPDEEEWTVEALLELERSDFVDLLSAPAQQLLCALDSLSASATRFGGLGGGGIFRGDSVEHRLEFKELGACVTVALRQLEPGRENAFLRRRQRMDLKISSMCIDSKGKQWHCLSADSGEMELYPVRYTGSQEYELEAALLLQWDENDRLREQITREYNAELKKEKALAAAARALPAPLSIVTDQQQRKRKLDLSDPVVASKKQQEREEGECTPSSCDEN